PDAAPEAPGISPGNTPNDSGEPPSQSSTPARRAGWGLVWGLHMRLDDGVRPAKGDLPNLYTPREVAAVLRCSLRHVYSLFDRGILRGPKGKPRRIFESSLREYLEDINGPPQSPQPSGGPRAADDTDRRTPVGTQVRSFRHLRL